MINWKGLLLLLFLIPTSNTFAQNYNFRNFNSEEGLTQSYVYSIIQDMNGYLWIGTDNGLFRYNGFKFENYPTSDSLTDNFITCGISDEDGLWFGDKNGRLFYYNGKKFLPIHKSLANLSSITQFAKSPYKEIWASTYSDGLLRLSRDTGVVKRYLFKEQTNIISFEFIDYDKLLIGTNTGLFFCKLKDAGEIEILKPVPDIPESKISSIQKKSNNSGFYVATENDGLFYLTVEGSLFQVSKIVADRDHEISGIQKIYEDSQSNLWICSRGNGLTRLSFSASGESPTTVYFNKAGKFATDNISTVYEDREGNIWSGNYGQGLTLITPRFFSVNKYENPLYGNNIFSIYINKDFRWIGTENGLLKIDQLTDKIIKFFSKGNGLPKDTVTAIYSTDGNVLWIGTEKNGLYRMETGNEKIVKYPIGNGSLENSINIIAGKGNEIWVGTKKGLCCINSDNKNIKWYSINQGGLPHNYINCIYVDKTDILWVSTRSNTLAYIQGEKVFKIPVYSSSGILTLGPITEDSDSHIWVGSNGNGVYMVMTDSIANFTVREGLLYNYCYSLICDNQKNIWVGHKGGLSRIRTINFSVKPMPHIESFTDNYQFNPNAIFKDQKGKIWFGSQDGLISYDPSMDSPSLLPPVLGITSVKINDIEKDFKNKIILSPGKYKIRIDFLGISLKEPALVTYQHKLEGYDQWSEITKNTFMTYNHVTEGNYTFILKASNGDGAVTENPLTIDIIIKKSVWKKWWFYFCTLFLLFSITVVYIKRREYKFQAEKRILEEKVRERTHEIQSQKNEIELQRDLINEKNAHITSSIRYASHIQDAVLPPHELLNKLFPDNFILSRPKDIVSGDFYWLAEKDNKIIFTVADCTGHGVPGAFMSVLGITLLNEIVNIGGITNSDVIVEKLRVRVVDTLQQNRKAATTLDGMDMALCVLDKDQNKLQYTGALSDLVLIRDAKLEIIRADRFSVCLSYRLFNPFTLKEIHCRKGDVLYLFSDGYQDQFGGDYDRKFLKNHFYLTLLEIHKLPMPVQKETLEKKLDDWVKGGIQTDDITVMGIRL